MKWLFSVEIADKFVYDYFGYLVPKARKFAHEKANQLETMEAAELSRADLDNVSDVSKTSDVVNCKPRAEDEEMNQVGAHFF